jgi:pimeloyl-ACP methyl ester carboxylesterase
VYPRKSTIVRINLAALRTSFGLLERVAPGLGARWAARRWLTVPVYRGRPRPAVFPPGEPFTVTVAGRRVRGRSWGSGPAVYLVHGWGGIGTQLRAYLEPLLGAGYRVVMFDAPSHGASDPGRLGPGLGCIPEMAEALAAVVEAHGPAHAVLAHSLGCNAAFIALTEGLRVERLVFLAPMAQPLPYTAIFGATLGFDARIRGRMLERVAGMVGRPWSAFDIPSRVGELTPPPLLTVHDPNDRETRYADSVALARAWPDATLHTVRELGHWRLLHDRDTVARAVAFITAEAADRAAAS